VNTGTVENVVGLVISVGVVVYLVIALVFPEKF
jgi:K+-transporting ATPase KdpF subunit